MKLRYPTVPRSWAAFTLTELLVVMGILGLLAAMIFPALSKAKGKTRTVQCQNNLKQLNLANASYTDANGRRCRWRFTGRNQWAHPGSRCIPSTTSSMSISGRT